MSDMKDRSNEPMLNRRRTGQLTGRHGENTGNRGDTTRHGCGDPVLKAAHASSAAHAMVPLANRQKYVYIIIVITYPRGGLALSSAAKPSGMSATTRFWRGRRNGS
jgi:hypothetical protein